MNEMRSEFSLGVTLEAALQESRNQTILLSDLRENSEARKKADEKTLEQLRRLQLATSQSLEIAKTQKKQSKDDSITFKAMHEITSKENAIIARRQTSTMSALTNTVNIGLNIINQKMFIALESLGQSLSTVFSAVGRGIENKLYSFMGSLSILIKPIVGLVKVGFSVMTKLISVPLKMIWDGLKTFSKTLFGKMAILGTAIIGAYYFITRTDFGNKIYTALSRWATEKMNNPNSTFGKVLKVLNWIKLGIGTIIGYLTLKSIFGLGKDLKHAFTFCKSIVGSIVGKVRDSKAAAAAATVAKPAANSIAGFPGIWNGVNTAGKAASTGTTVAKTASSASKLGSTALKVGKFAAKGFNPASLIAGLGIDYLADKTENQTTKSLLKVGSSALSGAGIGATIGSIVPGIGTAIGGAVGGLIGGGASLLFGEGKKLLFGEKNDNTADNEIQQLDQMSKRQEQTQNANIRVLDDIAEAVRESNKLMTKVVDKQNVDSQYATSRTDTLLNEQNRHADAVATNDKLDKIRDGLVELTAIFKSIANNMARQSNNANSSLSIQPNIV